MATFLLSWLSKQYGALDASVFLREQPGEWLVLERIAGAEPPSAEPLAARLALRRDRPRFTMGRDPASDLIVNGLGVEPTHAILEQQEGGPWTIRRGAEEVQARLDGLPLGDFPVALGSGARIEIGDVRFTFYAGPDFYERLRPAA